MERSNLDELIAKQAIVEVVLRYCRAMDRMDRELALSCWHPGGTDDHSPGFKGTAEGFIDWVWPIHGAMLWTQHTANNTLIALADDKGGVESYCTIILRSRRQDKVYDLVTAGRYLDRFELRNGRWAITHRQCVSEWHRVDPVTAKISDFRDPPFIAAIPVGEKPLRAARDRSDLSYLLLL